MVGETFVTPGADLSRDTVTISFTPRGEGSQLLMVEAPPQPGEANTENNRRAFRVQVLKDKPFQAANYFNFLLLLFRELAPLHLQPAFQTTHYSVLPKGQMITVQSYPPLGFRSKGAGAVGGIWEAPVIKAWGAA